MLVALVALGAGCIEADPAGSPDTGSEQTEEDTWTAGDTRTRIDTSDAASTGCEAGGDVACSSCAASCTPPPHARSLGCTNGSCQYECVDGWSDENGDLQSPSGDGCEAKVSDCKPTNDGEEICDGKDNDCDGTVDEKEVLLREDFEGEDVLSTHNDWSKNADREFLNVDSDVESENAPQGTEFAKASFQHGSCEIPAGLAGGKSFTREIDRITVDVNADVAAWGRVAIWVLDQAPPGGGERLIKVWAANAKGGGFSTDGWTELVFDANSNTKRTKPSGAIVETKALPDDLEKSSVVFIFGNDDDTRFCENGDHRWELRVDDLKVTDLCE